MVIVMIMLALCKRILTYMYVIVATLEVLSASRCLVTDLSTKTTHHVFIKLLLLEVVRHHTTLVLKGMLLTS